LYYVERSSSPGSCGDLQNSTYYWADPTAAGLRPNGSIAEFIAPSGTQVYADANYGSYYSTGGTYSITQPSTGDDYEQPITNVGIVGSDSSC
jgi:hypothetical protein|tara:strand:- start:664 stop:939 length:276 start_codon:yes stop_codon:yes gene_type:complete